MEVQRNRHKLKNFQLEIESEKSLSLCIKVLLKLDINFLFQCTHYSKTEDLEFQQDLDGYGNNNILDDINHSVKTLSITELSEKEYSIAEIDKEYSLKELEISEKYLSLQQGAEIQKIDKKHSFCSSGSNLESFLKSPQSLKQSQLCFQQSIVQKDEFQKAYLVFSLNHTLTMKSLQKILCKIGNVEISTFNKINLIINSHVSHQSFQILHPTGIDQQQYKIDKLAHSSLKNTSTCQQQNEIILANSLHSLIQKGQLSILQLQSCNNAKYQYKQLELAEQFQQRPDLPFILQIPNYDHSFIFDFKLKKRHYWITGPPNTGKTTLGYYLLENYRTSRVEYDQGSFEDVYPDTQLFIMDAIQPLNKPSLNVLEKICDGTKKLKVKYVGPKELGIVIVIILSNYEMKDVYPKDIHKVLDARFQQVKLTKIFV